MTSRCFVIFNFCGLYEQQTSRFFRRKFSSTKTSSKFSDILRLISNLSGLISYTVIYLPHDSLYQLCME